MIYLGQGTREQERAQRREFLADVVGFLCLCALIGFGVIYGLRRLDEVLRAAGF